MPEIVVAGFIRIPRIFKLVLNLTCCLGRPFVTASGVTVTGDRLLPPIFRDAAPTSHSFRLALVTLESRWVQLTGEKLCS